MTANVKLSYSFSLLYPAKEYTYLIGIIAEPFSLNNGLLTQAMKLQREKVLERYRAEIAQLYEGPGAG